MLPFLLSVFACGYTLEETPPPLPAYPEKTEAEAAPAREKIAAFVTSWAAVVPLVPDSETPPAPCTETGGPIPLVEFEDLIVTTGKPLSEVEKRLTPPGLLGRLSGDLTPGEAVGEAGELDETIDRIWVRRILSRTEATFVPAAGDTPQVFTPGEVRGVLALVGRLPPRLLCAGALLATNRDQLANRTADAKFAELAAKDLEQVLFEVTHGVRGELTGEELGFPTDE